MRDEDRLVTHAATKLSEDAARSGTIRTMPSTTAYQFGDLVLVPFPFTDQTGIKMRPAIVVSSEATTASGPMLC
jgi:hypothetical protein